MQTQVVPFQAKPVWHLKQEFPPQQTPVPVVELPGALAWQLG
jgi:hypothetical protein